MLSGTQLAFPSVSVGVAKAIYTNTAITYKRGDKMVEEVERCSLLILREAKEAFDRWQRKLAQEKGRRVSQTEALMELLTIVGIVPPAGPS